MKEHDRFIETFKSVESLIKEVYSDSCEASFKWYEEQQTDVEYMNKLRLCRNIRNFIQHNKGYETFVQISPEMQRFLEMLLIELKAKRGTVWDISTSIGRCFVVTEDSLVFDVVESMNKKGLESCIVLKEDKTFAGVFSARSLYSAILGGKQLKKTKINKLEDWNTSKKNIVCFVSKEDEQEVAFKYFKSGCNFILVTENGKQNGKVLGMVKNMLP